MPLTWLSPIRERVEKATAAPWVEFEADWDGTPYHAVKSEGAGGAVICVEPLDIRHYESCSICTPEGFAADFTLIANAPTDLTRLLRTVEVLEPLVDIIAGMPCESLIDGDEDCAASGAEDDDPGAWCLTCSARRALADVREG